eukprot:TRINITY_DN8460_c0_g1_i2.p1 TRINITY_DN8460_c0_g1~~TRINITY_DN8460_c0_g1_i2.p1  ORF type:complete len:368 (+),score=77.72 TRINITY_DN8460_c0_g1_i2:414-1517(+)
MEHSLSGIVFSREISLSTVQIRTVFRQILSGLAHMHEKGIAHRDLKSQNILINTAGDVKISDFGLAKNMNTRYKEHTNCVVTLWYRAPELLLGETNYSMAIDMWSAGCVLAELYKGEPLFKENDEKSVMAKVIERLVSSPVELDGFSLLPNYGDMVGDDPSRFTRSPNLTEYMKKYRPDIDDEALDLIYRCLTVNPAHRISVQEALDHPFIAGWPSPRSLPNWLPALKGEYHENLIKKRYEAEKASQSEQRNGRPPFGHGSDRHGGDQRGPPTSAFSRAEIRREENARHIEEAKSFKKNNFRQLAPEEIAAEAARPRKKEKRFVRRPESPVSFEPVRLEDLRDDKNDSRPDLSKLGSFVRKRQNHDY